MRHIIFWIYFHIIPLSNSKYSCERKKLFYENSTMPLWNSKWCACTHAWETKEQLGELSALLFIKCNIWGEREKIVTTFIVVIVFWLDFLKKLTTVMPFIWNSTLSSQLILYCSIITWFYILGEERLIFP